MPTPLILSIDTATQACSIALQRGRKPLALQTLWQEQSHAEQLAPMIQYLLAVSGHQAKELTAIALAAGPGSYTGLRIGAATAKGLCYALGLPLITINTLEAMAHGVRTMLPGAGLLCPMLEARRMEVYCLLMDRQGKVLMPTQALVVTSESFAEWLDKHPIYFFGNGATKCQALWGHHPHAHFLPGVYPAAQQVGSLAYDKWERQAFTTLDSFEPLYLKPWQGRPPA